MNAISAKNKISQSRRILLALIFALIFHTNAFAADLWKITAYCSCVKCCGKSDGITASGKKVRFGYVACNWLPFGTKVSISSLGDFTVQDRGARSLFGSKSNHIKHLDIYFPTHKEALKFGVKYLEVTILK
jgi:3D (Asp-Asp-Asp) domain-containing protein